MENRFGKEYAGNMWGFSKKRFFITLGLSVVVWLVSIMVQFFLKGDNVKYGFFIFSKSCEVTGYPLARCIPDYDKGQIYLSYLINIFFWFWVIHLLLGKWFKK